MLVTRARTDGQAASCLYPWESKHDDCQRRVLCGLSKGGHHLKSAKRNSRLEPHSSSKPLNRRTMKGSELCCFFICANTTQTKYD